MLLLRSAWTSAMDWSSPTSSFAFSLSFGKDISFNFQNKEPVKSSCYRKNKYPSQLRREAKRKGEREQAEAWKYYAKYERECSTRDPKLWERLEEKLCHLCIELLISFLVAFSSILLPWINKIFESKIRTSINQLYCSAGRVPASLPMIVSWINYRYMRLQLR